MVEDTTITSKYLIVGDIGGTNCRLQIVNLSKSNEIILSQKRATKETPTFHDAINGLIEKSGIIRDHIVGAVIGIAGPVFGGTIVFQQMIAHWCPLREPEIAQKTGLKRVVMLNDFVANGYGVIGLQESELVPVFKPENLEWFDDSVKLVLGVGTGLGACQLTRQPSKVAGELGNYHVNSSEPGMTRFTHYEDIHREYEKFLNLEKGIKDRDDA